MPSSTFSLDPRLEGDTRWVRDFPLSTVRLMDDASYPWIILVPKRTGLVELIDLEGEDRTQLGIEIDAACRALKAATGCHKLNVAALGNMVRQLHVHIIARFEDDPAWPGPVWGMSPLVHYEDADMAKLLMNIRHHLDAQI